MKEKIISSDKRLLISDFTKKYYQLVFFNIIILLIFFLLLPGKLYEKIIYFSIFFLFLMIATRIELIKSLIIKRLDQSFETTNSVSEAGVSNEENLYSKKITYQFFKKKERVLKIIVFISIIAFFKFIGNNPQNKFYLTWTYSFTTLSLVLFFSSHNIFKYFQKLIGVLFEHIDFQKYYSNQLTENDRASLNIHQYIKKLKKLQFVSLLSVVVISFVLILLKNQSGITYLPVFLIVVLGIIALDLNRVVKVVIPLLSRYDSFINSEVE